MTITATILADSVSREGSRLTTMQLRYPRLIHSEFMTHRAFSRNASSSRAIPVERLIQDVLDDTAMPVSWGKNKKGMQAGAEHSALVAPFYPAGLMVPTMGGLQWNGVGGLTPQEAWLKARDSAVTAAGVFAAAGYHKQICNRLLEPFAHINVVVTATDWDNFFAQRLGGADPTMMALAHAMWNARENSTPKPKGEGCWHLPYIQAGDHASLRRLVEVSSARCARVSYLTHDGRKTSIVEDFELFQQLEAGGHWSPLEHQAHPTPGKHANLNGWSSHRTEIGQ